MIIAEMWLVFLLNLQFAWWSFLRSPMATYHKLRAWRDWILAKVEYLQSESQKWKALFTTLRLPYIFLTRGLNLSPNMAISLLIGGSAVTSGVVVAEVMEPPSFTGGSPGIYDAPQDIPVYFEDQYNTLRIDLSTVSVSEIDISNVSAGTSFAGGAIPSGQDTVLKIGGNPTSENFTATWIEVGTLNFERNRCKSLTLTDIDAHTINIIGNASDGQSISVSPGIGTDNRMRQISGGHHQADVMSTSGGLYDRIWVQAPVSA